MGWITYREVGKGGIGNKPPSLGFVLKIILYKPSLLETPGLRLEVGEIL
jgi:hypothetical protein